MTGFGTFAPSPAGPGEYGEMHKTGVEVEDVEAAGQPLHLLEHHHVEGNMVPDILVKPQGLAARGHQVCAGSGIAAGEQGDLLSLSGELIGQVRNHSLGASVKTGRHAFDKGRNLRDLHGLHCCSCGLETVRP
jgi:hypothetical protein